VYRNDNDLVSSKSFVAVVKCSAYHSYFLGRVIRHDWVSTGQDDAAYELDVTVCQHVFENSEFLVKQ